MDEINLLILFLLCSSTTATNSTSEKPNVLNQTVQAYSIGGAYNSGGQYGDIPQQKQQIQWPMPLPVPMPQPHPYPYPPPQPQQLLLILKYMMQLQLQLIQQLRQQLSKPMEGAEVSQINNGYEVYYPIGAYKFHPELLRWDEARMVCESEGTHLAIINSQREADVLVKMATASLTSFSIDYIYLGFNDKDREGVYVTVTGETLEEAGYARWQPGQPDNGGVFGACENCGSMHISGLLNDIHCTKNKVPFICEDDRIIFD